jgi:transposase
MRLKRSALRQALTGRFDEHHGELARMLLDQIDALSEKLDRMTARVDELVEQIPEAHGHDASGAGGGPSVLERLDEIPGVGPRAAQIILAEVGLDMTQFPTAVHLVSWAKLSPRTIQSGPRTRSGRTGKGNPYLKGALGEAAAAAART